MSGAQFVGATTHATRYLVVADSAPAFVLKKRKLLQKSLNVFSVLMIWLSSTNYLAVKLTNVLGSVILWSAPMDFKVLENKRNVNQSTKQNRATNSSKPGAEKAIVNLGGGRKSGVIEYPQHQDHNIEARAMERVRYGVPYLNFLPILLTDATSSNELTDAEVTEKILKNEFLV
jgi:hypothetical protein